MHPTISLEAFISSPVTGPAVNRWWKILFLDMLAGLVYYGFTTYNGRPFMFDSLYLVQACEIMLYYVQQVFSFWLNVG